MVCTAAVDDIDHRVFQKVISPPIFAAPFFGSSTEFSLESSAIGEWRAKLADSRECGWNIRPNARDSSSANPECSSLGSPLSPLAECRVVWSRLYTFAKPGASQRGVPHPFSSVPVTPLILTFEDYKLSNPVRGAFWYVLNAENKKLWVETMIITPSAKAGKLSHAERPNFLKSTF